MTMRPVGKIDIFVPGSTNFDAEATMAVDSELASGTVMLVGVPLLWTNSPAT